MKKQIIRAAATTVLGLGLMSGFAAADINTSGPGSDNSVKTTSSQTHTVKNNNNVGLTSTNDQSATSGSSSAHYNTTAGDVATGSAMNDNTSGGSLTIGNNSAASLGADETAAPVADTGSITESGPGSSNTITSKSTNTTTVTNTNNVNVQNSNNQTAKSGSANVSDNTTGGSAKTGDVSNTSSSTYTIDIEN